MAQRATYRCKNPACGMDFTARIADRERGWAQCCSKACAFMVRNPSVLRQARQTPAARIKQLEDAIARACQLYQMPEVESLPMLDIMQELAATINLEIKV